MTNRTDMARELYRALAAGDRAVVSEILADEFTFSSPVDVALDRAEYFERCWPGAGQNQQFNFVRLIESGGEVIVTYEMTRQDGSSGRNTEILGFHGRRCHACGGVLRLGSAAASSSGACSASTRSARSIAYLKFGRTDPAANG